MSTPDVKIIELEPLHIAGFHSFGTEPESGAFAKLKAWLTKHDRMATVHEQRIFGFNNPSPSTGSPNYGYEVWITVEPELEAEDEMEVKDFEGGLYAILACQVESGEEIPDHWQQLLNWLAASPYNQATHQWLEEHHWSGEGEDPFGGQLTLDLYAPVSK